MSRSVTIDYESLRERQARAQEADRIGPDLERAAVTAEEFLAGYAERSGVTPQQLLDLGRRVAPCECDYDRCEGWQLAYTNDDKGV